MTFPEDVEVRLEWRQDDRVCVFARYRTKFASRVFERRVQEGELFLWLAEEFHLGMGEPSQPAETTCASR